MGNNYFADITSKTNERLCGIFLEKIVRTSTSPVTPFFFVAKIVFFRIFRKNVEFFFNEIDCKKLFEIFSMNSAVKNFEFFFNSLKLTITNFRKFFTAEFIEKTFRKFFTVNFIEKKIDIFSENSKKKIFVTKKKVSQGGVEIRTIFPGKSDTTFRWVLT